MFLQFMNRNFPVEEIKNTIKRNSQKHGQHCLRKHGSDQAGEKALTAMLQRKYQIVCQTVHKLSGGRHNHGKLYIFTKKNIKGSACQITCQGKQKRRKSQKRHIAEICQNAADHIRVNAVAPGMIWTDMLREVDQEAVEALKQSVPLKEIGEVEDIAQAVAYLVEAKYVTGQTLGPNGGLLMP